MGWLRNKSERAFSVGGILIAPLNTVEVTDDILDNERVKEIIAAGELEVVDGPQDPGTISQPPVENETIERVPPQSSTPKP